jgi:hypothetical protein
MAVVDATPPSTISARAQRTEREWGQSGSSGAPLRIGNDTNVARSLPWGWRAPTVPWTVVVRWGSRSDPTAGASMNISIKAVRRGVVAVGIIAAMAVPATTAMAKPGGQFGNTTFYVFSADGTPDVGEQVTVTAINKAPDSQQPVEQCTKTKDNSNYCTGIGFGKGYLYARGDGTSTNPNNVGQPWYRVTFPKP